MLDIEPRVVPRSETKKKIQLLSPATLIQEKVLIGDTDMPQALQAHAVRAASEALDMHEVTDFKEIAYYIKNGVMAVDSECAPEESPCSKRISSATQKTKKIQIGFGQWFRVTVNESPQTNLTRRMVQDGNA